MSKSESTKFLRKVFICDCWNVYILIKYVYKRATLHNLVPFVQCKKSKKHLWRSDNTFSKVAG